MDGTYELKVLRIVSGGLQGVHIDYIENCFNKAV